MQKAAFIRHRVAKEGLYIMGITGPGLLPDVEVFVPRDDAEEFGWIDPLEEDQQSEDDHIRSVEIDHELRHSSH